MARARHSTTISPEAIVSSSHAVRRVQEVHHELMRARASAERSAIATNVLQHLRTIAPVIWPALSQDKWRCSTRCGRNSRLRIPSNLHRIAIET